MSNWGHHCKPRIRKLAKKHLLALGASVLVAVLAPPMLACSSVSTASVSGRIPPNYQLEDPNWASFIPKGKRVDRQIHSLGKLSGEEINEIKDAMVATRFAYSDYSVLLGEGLLDEKGKVLDLDQFYERAARIAYFPYHDVNWSAGEINWARKRFEIIAIREADGSDFGALYQGNLALSRSLVSGAYYIGIAGTDSIPDVVTNTYMIPYGNQRFPSADLIDEWFRDLIPQGAKVILAGHSLGGSEVVLNYFWNPSRYAHVYPIQALGIGGRDGTFYSLYQDDGRGDPKITEIIGDDSGEDFNDMVVSWGYIPTGRVLCIDRTINVGESESFGPDLDFFDSHFLGNMWATLEKRKGK